MGEWIHIHDSDSATNQSGEMIYHFTLVRGGNDNGYKQNLVVLA